MVRVLPVPFTQNNKTIHETTFLFDLDPDYVLFSCSGKGASFDLR